MRTHVPIVDPPPPGVTGTTVHTDDDESRPRGLGAGLCITILAIGMAVAFGAGTDSDVETPVHIVAQQAQTAEAGAPPTTPSGRPVAVAFGVSFPDLARRLGWRPVGRRDDVVDGRQVSTVVYGREGRRLAYSVVDGPPLPAPPGARTVPGGGPGAIPFESAGRTAVMTTRDGRSVLVSGAGVPRVALIRAARTR